MELTREEWVRLRLLSDQTLYPEAIHFIEQHDTVDGQSQIRGLLNHSRSADDLMRFIKHQGRERNWSGKKEYYRAFYRDLETYMDNLRQRTKAEFELVPDGLTRNEERTQMSRYVQVLAQEFIQHLAAENLWKGKTR